MGNMPTFYASNIDIDGLRLHGQLDSTTHGDGTELKPGHACYLRFGAWLIFGALETRGGNGWVFTLKPDPEIENPAFPDGVELHREFEVWDGYYGQRAAIVLEDSLKWEHRVWFPPSDTWDHDHCDFCWEKISTYPDTQHDCFWADRPPGYRPAVACVRCYTCFVEPRSLDFKEISGPASSR